MSPLERLVEAAKVWADFQDPDSVLEQQNNRDLRVRAEIARQGLLYAIDNLMEGRPESQTD